MSDPAVKTLVGEAGGGAENTGQFVHERPAIAFKEAQGCENCWREFNSATRVRQVAAARLANSSHNLVFSSTDFSLWIFLFP